MKPRIYGQPRRPLFPSHTPISQLPRRIWQPMTPNWFAEHGAKLWTRLFREVQISDTVSLFWRPYSTMIVKPSVIRAQCLTICLLLSTSVCGSGCKSEVRKAEAAAIATAMKHPASGEFRLLFPLNAPKVVTLDRTTSPPRFLFEGIAHGRYLITMILPLTVDHSNLRVTDVGSPSFILQEFKSISRNEHGQWTTKYNTGAERRFGIEEWQRLVLSGGDLSVLGLKPITNAPLPLVERYLNHSK
jgi:hypothetical protein